MYKQQLIAHLAQRLKSYGYTVYLSADRRHGFYTDGVRVVSFGGSWELSADFSGNYVTDVPSQAGTGWQIAKELGDVTEEQAAQFISANAPLWAVRGASWVRYVKPEEHLAMYKGSGYTVAE
jgi:hypothetical protein